MFASNEIEETDGNVSIRGNIAPAVHEFVVFTLAKRAGALYDLSRVGLAREDTVLPLSIQDAIVEF